MVVADGRSRKAAATKKAAAVRARAARDTGGKRGAQRVDEARARMQNPELKMGIADPGFGGTVRVGGRGLGRIAGSRSSYLAYVKGVPKFFGVKSRVSDGRMTARPARVDPPPVALRSTTPPKVTNAPPTKTFSGGPAAKVSVPLARVAKRAPRTTASTSRTTSVLKDPTARWQAGQATRTSVGMPIARKAGTGRAAKAAATKKKK